MLRWRGLEATPGDLGRTVVTIGMYDGVHRGHQKLIGAAVARARAMRRPCLLLTFDPHPAEVVRPGSHPAILTVDGPQGRAGRRARRGRDVRAAVHAGVHAAVAGDLHPHRAGRAPARRRRSSWGENFTYGHRAAGTVDTLAVEGRRFGFAVEGVPLANVGADDGGTTVTISSTYIRACVAAGDMVSAARALGRPHRVDGVVVRGDRRGRDLGYPTANVESPPFTAIPADGVYAGHLVTRDPRSGASRERFPAAISVGTNPTFQGSRRTVEAFVLDYDGDLYGEHVGVEFVQRLRPMAAFPDVDALLAAMAKDVADTRRILGHVTRAWDGRTSRW